MACDRGYHTIGGAAGQRCWERSAKLLERRGCPVAQRRRSDCPHSRACCMDKEACSLAVGKSAYTV